MSRSTAGRPANPQEGKLRQFELLARVSSVINSTLEPKEVLNRVLAEAVQAMQATSGSLVFIDPHTQLLQIEVAIGLTKQAQETQLAIGRGVTVYFYPAPNAPGLPDAGLGTVEEGAFVNGKWVPGRLLAGDDTEQGQYLDLRSLGILRFTLYRYH